MKVPLIFSIFGTFLGYLSNSVDEKV